MDYAQGRVAERVDRRAGYRRANTADGDPNTAAGGRFAGLAAGGPGGTLASAGRLGAGGAGARGQPGPGSNAADSPAATPTPPSWAPTTKKPHPTSDKSPSSSSCRPPLPEASAFWPSAAYHLGFSGGGVRVCRSSSRGPSPPCGAGVSRPVSDPRFSSSGCFISFSSGCINLLASSGSSSSGLSASGDARPAGSRGTSRGRHGRPRGGPGGRGPRLAPPTPYRLGHGRPRTT